MPKIQVKNSMVPTLSMAYPISYMTITKQHLRKS